MSSSQHDHSHHPTSEHPAPVDADHQLGHTHDHNVTSHTPPTEHQARFPHTTPQIQAGRGQHIAKTDFSKENISVAPRRPDYGGRGQYDVVPNKPQDPPPKRRTQPLLGAQEPSLTGRGQQNAAPDGYLGIQHSSTSAREEPLVPEKSSHHDVTPDANHPLHHSSTFAVQQPPGYGGRGQYNAAPESLSGQGPTHPFGTAVQHPPSYGGRGQYNAKPDSSRTPSPEVKEKVSLGPQPPSSSGRRQYNLSPGAAVAPSAAVRELVALAPQPPSTGGRGQYNASPDSSD